MAVIGTSCSSAALGVADTIMSREGHPARLAVEHEPGADLGRAHQPFYARTAHNDRIQGAIVAEFALNEQGATKRRRSTTRARTRRASPRRSAVNFEAGDGTVTVQEQINSEDTDFKPLLRSIAEDDPDVLYAPVFVAACALILKQAAEIMPRHHDHGVGRVHEQRHASRTPATPSTACSCRRRTSRCSRSGDFYSNEFIPAYEEQFGTEPTSVFHAHAFDATNVLFDAIEQVAVENDDGSLSIPRTALRDAVFATSGYEGLTGTITCTELGDCATDVTIGIFEGPNWPVEGGAKPDTPVYSDTKSLDDVL